MAKTVAGIAETFEYEAHSEGHLLKFEIFIPNFGGITMRDVADVLCEFETGKVRVRFEKIEGFGDGEFSSA